ncbi:MAG: formate/nitrite transporter family protein [Sphingomonadaceae bacterium]|nr:formate/nitrite transporter family protein [Sphingomonadaceae bacterium]
MNEQKELSEAEEREVEEHSPPSAKVVHTVVSRQGDDELDRPVGSLFWSGIAAGVAIISSLSASGALETYLPASTWKHVVVSLGYPLGFLIVILGRLQLFTEHTMVAVLPFAREPSARNLKRVARLWSIVLIGNLLGAAAVAALVVFGRTQSPEVLRGMQTVAGHLLRETPLELLMQGIPAGFLIASVAWIRSATTDSGFWIVGTLTYTIALCGFSHVIAGAAEAFLLLWSGLAPLGWLVAGFLLPVFVGNVLGGTGLFAVLAHAQVKEEI